MDSSVREAIKFSIRQNFGAQVDLLTEEDWKAIHRALPNKGEIRIEYLKDTLNPIFWQMKPEPIPSEIIEKLNHLKRSTDTLKREFEKLDFYPDRTARAAMGKLAPHLNAQGKMMTPPDRYLTQVILAIDNAISDIEPSLGEGTKGREKIAHEQRQLRQLLTKAYTDLTGQKPEVRYSGSQNNVKGHYADFEIAVLKPFGKATSPRNIAESLRALGAESIS